MATRERGNGPCPNRGRYRPGWQRCAGPADGHCSAIARVSPNNAEQSQPRPGKHALSLHQERTKHLRTSTNSWRPVSRPFPPCASGAGGGTGCAAGVAGWVAGCGRAAEVPSTAGALLSGYMQSGSARGRRKRTRLAGTSSAAYRNGRPLPRKARKAARTSPVNASGCSRAAKWPPLSSSFQ